MRLTSLLLCGLIAGCASELSVEGTLNATYEGTRTQFVFSEEEPTPLSHPESAFLIGDFAGVCFLGTPTELSLFQPQSNEDELSLLEVFADETQTRVTVTFGQHTLDTSNGCATVTDNFDDRNSLLTLDCEFDSSTRVEGQLRYTHCN